MLYNESQVLMIWSPVADAIGYTLYWCRHSQLNCHVRLMPFQLIMSTFVCQSSAKTEQNNTTQNFFDGRSLNKAC